MQTRLYIDGDFAEGVKGTSIEVFNPHDGTKLADVAEARAEDVDRAVEAATAALPGWSSLAAMDRGRLLMRLADAVEANADELARLESMDTGHPIRDTSMLDVPRTAVTFRYFGGMADKVQGTIPPVEAGFVNHVYRNPVGVVGQIVPWNFPLMFTSWKLGPALAAGNTVVFKPAELTPLTSLRMAELIHEVGFPPGVVNVVPGYGHSAGARIGEHPGISKVSFTGSTATGRSLVQASAGNLKRLHLELGGKGANIVFGDADLDSALAGSAFAIYHNQGQACIAGSRLLLHESIAEEFIGRFVDLTESIRLGNPLDPKTEMGPLTSPGHRDRVLSYVKIARDEGGEVLTGGDEPDDPTLAGGCYVTPTVVRASQSDRVCREEVFGPFVTVSAFVSDDEVIEMANDVEYGLGGGLWTNDLTRAYRIADAMRTGMVWINCYKRVNPGSPFGGIGASGYGREMGFEAMHEYTESKSVWVNVSGGQPKWYSGG
jgi:acyl-CoA reductase-like NAD-dependent aldehyde dehydrogenase